MAGLPDCRAKLPEAGFTSSGFVLQRLLLQEKYGARASLSNKLTPMPPYVTLFDQVMFLSVTPIASPARIGAFLFPQYRPQLGLAAVSTDWETLLIQTLFVPPC